MYTFINPSLPVIPVNPGYGKCSLQTHFRYTSGVFCTFLYVDADPLRPDEGSSQPADGEQIEIGQTWVVQFNKEVSFVFMLNLKGKRRGFSLEMTF